jgi:hypothetical protein
LPLVFLPLAYPPFNFSLILPSPLSQRVESREREREREREEEEREERKTSYRERVLLRRNEQAAKCLLPAHL